MVVFGYYCSKTALILLQGVKFNVLMQAAVLSYSLPTAVLPNLPTPLATETFVGLFGDFLVKALDTPTVVCVLLF